MPGPEDFSLYEDNDDIRDFADRALRGDQTAHDRLHQIIESPDEVRALDALFAWSGIEGFVPLSKLDDKKRPLPPEEEWGTPQSGDGVV